LRIIETLVSAKASMSRQRWLRIESPSSNSKTTIADIRNSFSIRRSRGRSVSRRILSSTKNSTNNGTRIYSKLKRKMHKPSVSWKLVTLPKSKVIGKSSETSYH